MRYSVSFNFHRKPPFEIVTPAETTGITPGQVAFALLQVDCRDTGSVKAFLEMFQARWFYIDGKKIDAAAAGAFLPLEQAAMRNFIETVLLVPPVEWYLTDIPPSRRVAVFFHRFPQGERLKRHFQGVTMRPTVTARPEMLQRLLRKDGKPTKAAEEWKEVWEKREKQPERLLAVLPELETLSWRYETENLLAIAWLELFLMAEHDFTLKQCQNRKCREYFIPWPPNTLYCRECRGNTSRQRLYWQKKAEEMAEEERAALRKYHREHKRLVRQIQKLYAEGKSFREISEATGKSEEWVRARLEKVKKTSVSEQEFE
ncbi:hypothetical protein SAMN02745218_02694 [Desulfofundulus australicus DSM 11792]|uniref:Uncharacterized protein n=1 Tax=Desulfofundulus australicus DSM 11792 TaxID=1121425 RepID=A0A1M5D109_9FIRM|nr:hypothetical protein [Desulfofundulus australicus]SHF60723.1 hypothetical protein SAMN02745218_02694 [Desulfofundulus australicus DSM 11792]